MIVLWCLTNLFTNQMQNKLKWLMKNILHCIKPSSLYIRYSIRFLVFRISSLCCQSSNVSSNQLHFRMKSVGTCSVRRVPVHTLRDQIRNSRWRSTRGHRWDGISPQTQVGLPLTSGVSGKTILNLLKSSKLNFDYSFRIFGKFLLDEGFII